MSYAIRRAIAEDLAAIEACVQAAYAIYVERIGREPAPMLADYHALSARGVVYVLAEQDGVHGVLVMMRQGDSMFVENIAVDPRFQGQGLGRMLMAFAEQQAHLANLIEIRLYTNELMTENLQFYRRLGFEEEGRSTQDGYRRVFLRRRLT
ncbi:MAG: GNAT family N-acetyltransferase [Nitrososphaerota archaeon]